MDPKKKTLLPQPGVRFLFSFYDSGYSDPIGKSAGMNQLDEIKNTNEDQLEIMIKTDKLERKTDFYDRPISAPRNSSAGEDTDTGDETWPPKDPKQSMLQEKKAPLLSTGKSTAHYFSYCFQSFDENLRSPVFFPINQSS